MNYVEVKGGTAKERELVEKVVHWCIARLLPRVKTLDIEIELTNCSSCGYCLCTDDSKTFELEIRKSMSIYDLMSTICHEMVHVKQYYRKELKPEYGHQTWNNEKCDESTRYEDTPWEKEAFKLEKEMVIDCFKDLDVNLSRIKHDK